jgi:hypothetical protein
VLSAGAPLGLAVTDEHDLAWFQLVGHRTSLRR